MSGSIGIMRTGRAMIGSMLTAALFVGALYGIGLIPSNAASKKCDEVVATLLITKDPIELQRSAVLVRALNCDVERRLPR